MVGKEDGRDLLTDFVDDGEAEVVWDLCAAGHRCGDDFAAV